MTSLRSVPDLRALAFYLPQFHPIADNNAWWGAGFTEWINVVRARAAFAGHHQPQLPAELGFYDLRCRDTRHEQASLARAHGIHGFCYYHYWFNGTLLLERPLLDLLDDTALDFPFCVCWANENWTRRWDGREADILIAQQYEAYDADAHIAWLARAFADSRYVRVIGRPLFLIYRASDLPDIAGTIRAWRQASRRLGIGDLYVCAMANSQNEHSPDALTALGFDAVAEFEPNLRGVPVSRMMPEAPGMHVYNYRAIAERAMARPADTGARVFPCVFPSWDNTARRGWRATCIQNDDAALYAEWLDRACARASTFPPGERLVFINAWNEWAEGCHLEPDLRNGRLFLEATARVLGIDVATRDEAKAVSTAGPDVTTHQGIDIRLDVQRPIYIWGTGVAGRRIADALESSDVPFRGFLDNNPHAWGRPLAGHAVVAPAEVLPALTTSDAPPFILIGSMAQDAIALDIQRAGGRVIEHYLLDGGGVNLQRVSLPSPGHIRIGTWRRAVCPVCLSSVFTPAPADTGICQRCQSSDWARLAAVLFCDRFDWAHPPLFEVTPRRQVRVLHVADAAEHVAALETLVTYERVARFADVPRRDVDLLLTHPRVGVPIEASLAYAAEFLRPGGQMIFTARSDVPAWASGLRDRVTPYGLVLGTLDRDWPAWGVQRASVWVFRKP